MYRTEDLGVKNFTYWNAGGTRKIIEREAYLEHSCDEWRIGKKEDVERLMADLKIILIMMKNQTEGDIKIGENHG